MEKSWKIIVEKEWSPCTAAQSDSDFVRLLFHTYLYSAVVQSRLHDPYSLYYFASFYLQQISFTTHRQTGTHTHTDARDHNTFRVVYDSREM